MELDLSAISGPPVAYSCVCSCGRSFSQQNAYTNHLRTCKKSKTRLAHALSKAKEMWSSRKRPRLGSGVDVEPSSQRVEAATEGLISTADLSNAQTVETSFSPGVRVNIGSPEAGFSAVPPDEPPGFEVDGADGIGAPLSNGDDDTMSLAERRPRWLNRRLPARFRDILPQPPPPLVAESTITPPLPSVAVPSTTLALRYFRTRPNLFGLFRRYHGNHFPTHDPEEALTLEDLTLMQTTPADTGACISSERLLLESPHHDDGAFYPYPNVSSFLLGDWYWNQGLQKSKESFKDLLRIIGNPAFRPEDITSTRWDLINTRLGNSANDDADDNSPFEGAGWKKTAVTIR
ncbi:hypothetical protein BV22DRAFT_1135740, partial [Leucogyrophana mollusca]